MRIQIKPLELGTIDEDGDLIDQNEEIKKDSNVDCLKVKMKTKLEKSSPMASPVSHQSKRSLVVNANPEV